MAYSCSLVTLRSETMNVDNPDILADNDTAATATHTAEKDRLKTADFIGYWGYPCLINLC